MRRPAPAGRVAASAARGRARATRRRLGGTRERAPALQGSPGPGARRAAARLVVGGPPPRGASRLQPRAAAPTLPGGGLGAGACTPVCAPALQYWPAACRASARLIHARRPAPQGAPRLQAIELLVHCLSLCSVQIRVHEADCIGP